MLAYVSFSETSNLKMARGWTSARHYPKNIRGRAATDDVVEKLYRLDGEMPKCAKN